MNKHDKHDARYSAVGDSQSDAESGVNGLLGRASRALGENRLELARELLGQAASRAPNSAEVWRLTGIVALLFKDHGRAVESLRKALSLKPGNSAICMTLGSVLFEAGDADAGLKCLARACELAPASGECWFNYGVALEFAGFEKSAIEDLERAASALARAVRLDPANVKARTKLANVQIAVGATADAVEVLRETLRLRPDCVGAWALLSGLKTERLTSADARRLQRLLRRVDWNDDDRITLSFALGKAWEDQMRYADAFEMVATANALARRQLAWDRNAELSRVAALEGAFSGLQVRPLDPTLGREIIFIVCLPRSGSTLTEQILASHSQVQGGGETKLLIDILQEETDRVGSPFPVWAATASAADWNRLGNEYLDRSAPLREGSARFTDKSVDNWACVGAIAAMLPGARVVNSRRDPLETCFACYRQRFLVGGDYSYDLDDMVAYYAGYERLASLWQELFPDRYWDASYEALQEDAEGQIRRLLAFCDLAFEPACLSFHQTQRAVLTMSSSQVREPIKRNTARARLYGRVLDPLRAKLRAHGLANDTASNAQS